MIIKEDEVKYGPEVQGSKPIGKTGTYEVKSTTAMLPVDRLLKTSLSGPVLYKTFE